MEQSFVEMEGNVAVDDGKAIELEIAATDELHGIAVVRVAGIVDMYSIQFLEDRLAEVLQRGAKHLILNLSAVKYAASVGIGALVKLSERVERMEGRVILTGVRPQMAEVISLLGFRTYLRFSDSEEEAEQLLTDRPSDLSFPIVNPCPRCAKQLRLTREGRFRCPKCRSILLISDSAQIHLA